MAFEFSHIWRIRIHSVCVIFREIGFCRLHHPEGIKNASPTSDTIWYLKIVRSTHGRLKNAVFVCGWDGMLTKGLR